MLDEKRHEEVGQLAHRTGVDAGRQGRQRDDRQAGGLEERQLLALEDSQRSVVETLEVPSYELPLLVGGIDLGGLYEIAGLLRDQGLA